MVEARVSRLVDVVHLCDGYMNTVSVSGLLRIVCKHCSK